MRWLVFGIAATAMACTATTAPEARRPAAGAEPTNAAPLPDRDPALAQRMIDEQGGILLDVRTSEEFDEAHLAGAVNISHDQLQAELPQLEVLTGGDKSKPIVTYCRSGVRAGNARETLEAAGYTNVTNVGGMSDYPAQ